VIHALRGIVDHHRHNVREYLIATLQDHIAYRDTHILPECALHAIGKGDVAATDLKARRRRDAAARALLAAGPRIALLVIELLADPSSARAVRYSAMRSD
jgi:hypothetical protein